MTGPALLSVAAAAGAAALAAGSPTTGGSARLAALCPAPVARGAPAAAGGTGGRWWLWCTPWGCGLVGWLLLGGFRGMVVGGLAVGLARAALSRLEGAEQRRERLALAAAAPLCLDLLAGCLNAGLPMSAALRTVGTSFPGTAGSQCTRAAVALERGASPVEAFADWVGDAATAGARVLVDSALSGAAAGPRLRELAATARRRDQATAVARAQAAAVHSIGPLACCFLPAFVLVGVLPAVLGLARLVR